MLNSFLGLTGIDQLHGAHVLPVLVASVGVMVLTLLVVFIVRAASQSGLGDLLRSGLLILAGVLVGSVLTDNLWSGNDGTLRRSLETRAAELTARSLAPGSALACLDAVASSEIEAACEKALFDTPEAVAAAIAYVDARVTLVVAGAPLAERDASYRPSFERALRAIEADRFGLVAHVLTTRGCQSAACADLKLVRDNSQIMANMMARTFESHVARHAAAWQSGSTDVASASQSSGGLSLAPPAPVAPAPVTVGAARGAPTPQFDYPTSASIPAVSIMNAEPAAPGSATGERAAARAEQHPEPRAKATPKRSSPPPRRQAVQEAPAAAPPMSVLPPPPPVSQEGPLPPPPAAR